jgi:hypothetical protein
MAGHWARTECGLLLAILASASCGAVAHPNDIWSDCSKEEKIVGSSLQIISSLSPVPVHEQANNSISQTLTWHGAQPLTNITVHLEQYWKVSNHWFKFFSSDSNFCKDQRDACPLRPGTPVVATTHLLPLATHAPYHGIYRSKQVYYEGDAHRGKKIGCVDVRLWHRDEEQADEQSDDPVQVASKGGQETVLAVNGTEGVAVPTTQSDQDSKPSAPCCEVCHFPRSKYFSVVTSPTNEGFCGEACMLPGLYPIFKIFEANLTLAPSRDAHVCHDQLSSHGRHFTVYNSTVTHGVPGLSITLDLYGPGSTRST